MSHREAYLDWQQCKKYPTHISTSINALSMLISAFYNSTTLTNQNVMICVISAFISIYSISQDTSEHYCMESQQSYDNNYYDNGNNKVKSTFGNRPIPFLLVYIIKYIIILQYNVVHIATL